MNKEQEIQEMARVVCLISNCVDNFGCDNCEYTTEHCRTQCVFARDAEELFNAGYRKADEVWKETAEAILKEVGDKVTYYEGEGSVFYERKPEWYYELCKKFGYKAE